MKHNYFADKFVSSMLEAVASIESEPSENESDEISSESSEEESSSETERFIDG